MTNLAALKRSKVSHWSVSSLCVIPERAFGFAQLQPRVSSSLDRINDTEPENRSLRFFTIFFPLLSSSSSCFFLFGKCGSRVDMGALGARLALVCTNLGSFSFCASAGAHDNRLVGGFCGSSMSQRHCSASHNYKRTMIHEPNGGEPAKINVN